MKIKFILIFLLPLSLLAGQLQFNHIETSVLLKKDKSPVTIDISLVLQGRDIASDKVQLMDTLQMALGAFWAETLLTYQGKKDLKKRIIAMAAQKYDIGIDFVYIQNILVENPCTVKRFKKILKESSDVRQ